MTISTRRSDSALTTTRAQADASTRRLLERYGSGSRHVIRAEAAPFCALALSADGTTLAGAAGSALCVFNTRSRQRTNRFPFGCALRHVAVNQDGQLLVTADEHDNVFLIDRAFATTERIASHTQPISVLALSDCGFCVAFGDEAGDVVVMRGQGDDLRLQCGATPQRLEIDPDSDRLTVYCTQCIAVFDIGSGEALYRYGRDGDSEGGDLAGELPLITTASGGFARFDPATAARQYQPAIGLSALDFTRDGALVATAHGEEVTVWDGFRLQRVAAIRPQAGIVADLKICNDSKSVYLCGHSATVGRYAPDGQALASYSDVYHPIMGAVAIDDDRRLVVIDEAGMLSVYDLADGSVNRFYPHRCCISKMAVRGSLVATGAHDGHAKVTDIDTGREVFDIDFRGRPVQGIALSDDGMVATGNRGGELHLYDLESGALARKYHGSGSAIRTVQISPRQRYLLSAHENGDVNVFDYGTAKLVNQYTSAGIVYAACFDVSDDFVLFGDNHGVINRVRSAGCDEPQRWPLHSTEVRALSLRGRFLSSIGIGDDAYVLDLDSGETVLDCPVVTTPYRRVAFQSRNGRIFVTGGQDGCLTFRDARDGSALAQLHHLGSGFLWAACARAAEPDMQWLWTDREDLVRVYRRQGEIDRLTLPGEPAYTEHLHAFNNRIMTMARVGMNAAAVQAASLHSQQRAVQRPPRRLAHEVLSAGACQQVPGTDLFD